MTHLEDARLSWQHAQADLQIALADLEKRVAETASADTVANARRLVSARQAAADDLLHRYITQLGKS